MTEDLQASLQIRMQNGDRQALSEAFTQHRERLWRMINFRMDPRLKARVDQDDILQEAYLDAERRLDHFRAEGSHSDFLWLRLICSQTLVNVVRRHVLSTTRDAGRDVSLNQALAAHSTSVSLARQFAASTTSPSQAAANEESTEKLIEALETMEPIDREVLALRHFEDLNNLEVAAVLNIMPTAASNRYVRAVARLKEVLQRVSDKTAAEGESGDA